MPTKREVILTFILAFVVELLLSVIRVILYEYTGQLGIVLWILPYIDLLITGIIVGYILKKKGWYYGAMFGLISLLISLTLNLFPFIFPVYTPEISTEMIRQMTIDNMLKQIMRSPINIFLSALGGYIGEYLSARRIPHKR